MPLPAEQVLSPLDAKSRQRSLHLVECPDLIAAIADIGQPDLDLTRQVQGRAEPLFRPKGHRFQANGLERGVDLPAEPSRCGKIPRRTRSRTLGHISIGERGVPDEQAIERRAQPVDVARRPDLVEVARRLLRAHVPRSSHRGSRERQRGIPRAGRGPTPPAFGGFLDRQGLGDSPIDNERLSERAEHDVLWLEVAVNDPSAVCISNRVARGDKALQQPAKGHLTVAWLLPSPFADHGTARSRP